MKRLLFSLGLLLCLQLAFSQEQKRDSVKAKAGVGVEFALNTCIGGSSNNTGNREEANFAYESVVSRGVDTVFYKPAAGFAIGLDLNLLFGKKRNIGLSAGILLIAGTNTFTMKDFDLEYQATDAEGRSFKRILRASEWKEKVKYLNLSIPVLFKYRYEGKKRISFFADIGPVVTVLSTAKPKIETSLDFEAIYSMSGGTPHYSEQSESTDWLITREMATSHISAGGPYSSVNDYFDQQYARGYYVGLDKTLSGTAPSVKYKFGFGALLRAGLMYKVSSIFSVSLGAQCLLVSSGRESSTAYKPVDVADDYRDGAKLNSILNSTGSLLKAQYGVNIGLHLKVAK
jgi:hypothetical protein